METFITSLKNHLSKILLLFVLPLHSLTLDEKIGQLFIVPACELRGEDHVQDLRRLIQEHHIGGIILKQGTAPGQVALIEKLQQLSSIPLLCVQDGEWGVAMRLTDVISFPKNMTLGAVQDLDLIYQLGQEIGRQCRIIGTHLNLAPVVDVNSNPRNPIIHMRSFGDDPLQVALRGELVARGIQSQGVMACAKHFPGHGDTAFDSHVDLPVINKLELYPFQHLIDSGISCVLTAHLSLDNETVTFSPRIVTDLLQQQMHFHQLIITDALNMKAVTLHHTTEEIALRALLAGHDLLLYGDHIAPNIDQILRVSIPKAIAAIKEAVQSGEISEELIDAHVNKILQIKQSLPKPLAEPINTPESQSLKKKLYEEAITLIGDLPQDFALVEWGEAPAFKEALSCDTYSLFDPDLNEKLQKYSSCVLSLANITSVPPHFGIPPEITSLQLPIPTTAVLFGTPYSLSQLPPFAALLIAYERDSDAQQAAAGVLLGRLPAKGKLPVKIYRNRS